MSPVRRYAEGTTVSVERSKSAIERLLRDHGATGLLLAWDDRRAFSIVQFRLDERMVHMTVEEPNPDDYLVTPKNVKRTPVQAKSAAEREHMRRWRALYLIIRAKLEMIEGGGSTAEREFMADLLLPDGTTLGAHVGPKLEAAYESGEMPTLMLPGG